MTVSVADPRVDARSGCWMDDPGFGVYVHIPFCLHRCHYCDFNTYEGQDSLHDAYVQALVRDIERVAARHGGSDATSVVFGGGTPTLLDAAALGRVLAAIRDAVGVARDAEVTIEANPETVDEAKFEALLRHGFNRFSIGVQSLVPSVLQGLGRRHSAERAVEAMAAARRAGVEDLNADLIFGSPWERPEDWVRSLAGVIEAEPDHVSTYALTIEEGTPLATLVRTRRIPDVNPDVQADRYAVATQMLRAAGYNRYEVSNWSKPGRASRHNVLYWSAGDYLGVGAGAHGHRAGVRWWSVKLPRAFVDAVDAGGSTEAGSERLDREVRAEEALMLGLRLRSGIEMQGFNSRFGDDFLVRRGQVIAEMRARGLVEVSGTWLSVPDRVTLLLNQVILSLVRG